jgi:hypothetical protein
VNDAFLGANPAQLGVGYKISPGLTPVGDQRGECAPFDAVGEAVNGSADNVIASANGKGLSRVQYEL